jgi:hypothetical protein
METLNNKSFIIQLNDFSWDTWEYLNQFITFIEGGDISKRINELNISLRKNAISIHYSDKVVEFSRVNTIKTKIESFNQILGKKINEPDIIVDLNLNNTLIPESIIPVFLIETKLKRFTLLLNFSKLNEKECYQFTYIFKDILLRDKSFIIYTYINSKFKKLQKSNFDNLSILNSTPVININQETFNKLFLKTIENKTEFDYLVALHYDFLNILRKLKISQSKKPQLERLIEILESFNKSKTPIFIILFYYVLDLGDFSIESLDKSLKNKNIRLIEKVTSYVEAYYNALKEIAENVIFHSEQKEGYFILQKKSILQKNYFLDTTYKFTEKTKYIEDLKNNPKNYLKSVVDVLLLDSGKTGITDSFKNHYKSTEISPNELGKIENFGLTNFFDARFIDYPKESHLDLRSLAHLGLKIFSKSIIDKDGFIYVETNEIKHKQSFIFKPDFNGGKPKRDSKTLDSNFFSGTHYLLSLPINWKKIVKEEISTVQINELLNSKTRIEEYQNDFLEKKLVFKDIDILPKYQAINAKQKSDYIEDTTTKILSKVDNDNTVGLSLDLNNIKRSVNDNGLIIKILAFLQIYKKFKYIVLYNLSDEDFIIFKTYIHILKAFKTFWSTENSIYLYDKSGIPLIIAGKSYNEFVQLNNQVTYNYGKNNLSKVDNYSINEKNELPVSYKILNLELDVFVTNKSMSLFECFVDNILEKELVKDDFGVKKEKLHVRLGSKVHLRDFYYAELFFQIGSFADRFAYVIAKKMINSFISIEKAKKENNILLIGYGIYSRRLLHGIKSTLEKYIKLKNPDGKHKVKYFVYENFDNLETKTSDFSVNTEVFFIIPISSTLTTNYKVRKKFFDITKNRFNQDNCHNFTLLLVRDEDEENYTKKNMNMDGKKLIKIINVLTQNL